MTKQVMDGTSSFYGLYLKCSNLAMLTSDIYYLRLLPAISWLLP